MEEGTEYGVCAEYVRYILCKNICIYAYTHICVLKTEVNQTERGAESGTCGGCTE
jgi:hypothetical protein